MFLHVFEGGRTGATLSRFRLPRSIRFCLPRKAYFSGRRPFFFGFIFPRDFCTGAILGVLVLFSLQKCAKCVGIVSLEVVFWMCCGCIFWVFWYCFPCIFGYLCGLGASKHNPNSSEHNPNSSEKQAEQPSWAVFGETILRKGYIVMIIVVLTFLNHHP